jgi:hypothetical protein
LRLKQAGTLAIVAACKFGLLLAMLEASAGVLEPTVEAMESVDVELLPPQEGQGVASRLLATRRLATRRPAGNASVAGTCGRQSIAVHRARGHRLPNGLCAPMQC